MPSHTKKQTKKAAQEDKQCVRQTSKRYTERSSPPYPGTACCGQTKQGNDGNMYVSKRASDGSCRWHPMTTRSQQQAKAHSSGCG